MIKDFGLMDIVYSKLNPFKKSDITDFEFRKSILNEDSSETWVCFLPWRIKTTEAKMLGLIPKNHKVIVYEGPIGLVNPNPRVAKDLQSEVLEDVDKLNLKEFKVLAYSIGTYLGVPLANNPSVKKLISVVPGAKLGACIWDGIATQEIRKMSMLNHGIKNARHYDAIIGKTNAISNLGNLPSDIEIHIASHDYYIKTHHGRKLIQRLIDVGKNPQVIEYPYRGHVSALIEFGMNNTL